MHSPGVTAKAWLVFVFFAIFAIRDLIRVLNAPLPTDDTAPQITRK